MVLSFSGDPFLAARAARRALRARGYRSEEVVELGEGMEAGGVAQQLSQSGLFGQSALLLDFDAAFRGQGGVKPRNEVIRALSAVPDDSLVVVLDTNASPSRQKTYRGLGEHDHLPTPRFDALVHWVRQELTDAGVRFRKDVPGTLADLFGEDLPGLAAEILKLAVLDEELTSERVTFLANRPAARDAFDLIEAMVSGDAGRSLDTCHALLDAGEAPPRVLGALVWQFGLVARCVGLRESRARVDGGLIAQTLKVKPFVAKKALAIAQKLDEEGLRRVLDALVGADVAMKTGRDDGWALEALTLSLALQFAPAGR